MKGNSILPVIVVLAIAGVLGTGLYILSQHKPDAQTPPQGATSLQVVDDNCLYVQGAHTCTVRVPLRTATTTPAAIQSPRVASSTLVSVSVQLDVASSSATVWDLAKATNAFATTTLLGTAYNVGASKRAFIVGSTSPTAGEITSLAPGTWIVLGERGGITAADAGTGFVPSGYLLATFQY